ncbi:MAG TPA: glycosyltransferase [Nitrosarchaeum sp.]|nr:glycosyltransferase [Nitrosarchaeum sp.]
MKLKILAIGDSTSNIYLMKKFAKNIEVHLIDFPKKGVDKTTTGKDGIEYFDSLLISKQVEKIKKIKDRYDLCIAVPWAGARIAYLAGINYVMYFVGGDITDPPFAKENKNYNFFERYFYKKILDNAIACVAPMDEYYTPLKKYRKDAIRSDRIFVDTELFNEKIQPIEFKKEKFTFLSAQRFGLEKGMDKIWKAIELCKSDFELLQVKWFIEDTTTEEFDELSSINKKLVDEKPDKVRFIPLIKRDELGRYFAGADAVMGQMRAGVQGGIEREAAFCKKPVICYTDPKKPNIIDGEEIIPPFLPKSNEPQEIADIMDKIVESKQFRDDLAQKEYEYVKKISDPELVSRDWENIFVKVFEKSKTLDRKISILDRLLSFIILKIEKIYIKKFKEKNIGVWGKEEYEKLIRG